MSTLLISVCLKVYAKMCEIVRCDRDMVEMEVMRVTVD